MTQFAREVERDLAWREKELSSLKHFAISSRDNPIGYASALRALWAMLYAHYEGFTKFCWELVLEEIQSQRVPRADLCDGIATLSLGRVFSRVRGDTSPEGLWQAFHVDVPYHMGEVAEFPEENRLTTNSNLWPALFREQSAKLGITCAGLESNEIRLKALVGRRNKIAHGESMTIKSLEEYQPYENATMLLIHELALCCIDCIESQRFKRGRGTSRT